ncbi:glycosyltransferase family 87 protein [Alicyclobacillus dauci]|uniref:DUF2029 domain-containing protein n=1 Tax=Alicyclobacillus dauci TaxID=1475485 RepID=A0ABY6Z5Y6_9BACL|nr:glycosyltransferase family 87 protein [Alicyclobacillus dauci]WAH38299.1 DUF2029 domain-containing protein [Alicyclobacillus dauci]
MFQGLLAKIMSASFKRITYAVIVVIAMMSTYLEWHGLARMNFLRYDFAFFYYAFEVVLHQSPAHLYDPLLQHQFLRTLQFPVNPNNAYVYPPEFSTFWSWLGLFPFRVAASLWLGISVCSYASAVYLLTKILWSRMSLLSRITVVFICITLTPFQVDVGVGNVDSILLLCIVLTFYFIRQDRKFLAGVPLGLAIAFKVTPLAVLVYVLLRKQWRTGMSAVITTGVLVGLTTVWLGQDVTLRYAQEFYSFGQTSMKNGPAPYNQSLLGVLSLFSRHGLLPIGTSMQHVAFIAFMFAVGVVIVYISRKDTLHSATHLAAGSLTTIVFSPLVEEMHMVFAVPAILVLAQHAQQGFVRYRQQRSSFWQACALTLLVTGSLMFLSLPMTFVVNFFVYRWPALYGLQTDMFWVIMIVLVGVIWQSHSLPQRLGQLPSASSDEERSRREI